MKISPTPPDVQPNGFYTATQAIAVLGMNRQSFYNRVVNTGRFKRVFCKLDNTFRYRGKDIIKFWNEQFI